MFIPTPEPKLVTAESWNQFALDIRAVNAANGWGLEYTEKEIPGYLALIHSEISEAVMAESATERAEELCDVIIRAVDLAELIRPGGFGPMTWMVQSPLESWGGQLGQAQFLSLHSRVSEILETYRKSKPWEHAEESMLMQLGSLTAVTYVLAATELPEPIKGNARYVVLESLLFGKLEKNRARGWRHGGRRT